MTTTLGTVTRRMLGPSDKGQTYRLSPQAHNELQSIFKVTKEREKSQ